MLRLVLLSALTLHGAEPDLRIRAGEGGEFLFDTGVLAGKLRVGGKSRGLSTVVHVPSGATLTQTRLAFGLLSVYRVFSGSQRHGSAAWDWPGTGVLHPDGSLETQWPAAPGRPFDLSTVYRWRSPSEVDLTVRVRARADLPDFEVFVASYFSASFTPAVVMTGDGFVAAAETTGDWQIFPRDERELQLVRGGRWLLPPNPIEWAVRPMLREALTYRRAADLDLTAVLMARPRDCVAIAAPREKDIHFSTYLCLFGRTVKAGEEAEARVRLAVVKGDGGAAVEGYRRFLRETVARR